jgi:hypothetical protein
MPGVFEHATVAAAEDGRTPPDEFSRAGKSARGLAQSKTWRMVAPLLLLLAAASVRGLAFAILALATTAHATVTNVAWYRLGENDPGAASGLAVTSATTDAVGANHLRQFGGPLYTDAISADAAFGVGSSLAVQFNGASQYLSNGLVSTAINNFGIEAWVKPNSTSGASTPIAYNGTGGNGWGLLQSGNRFSAAFGGVTVFDLGPVVIGTWSHLALVRDGGTTKLFFNGSAVGTSTIPPNAPTVGFELGFRVQPLFVERFNGAIDEVRVFHFAAGQFRTNDLLVNMRPTVETRPASTLALTSARLNGRVTTLGSDMTAWFEWGPTTNYGNVTPPVIVANSSNAVAVSADIAGQFQGQTNHFRLVATNANGRANGADLSFAIPAFPGRAGFPPLRGSFFNPAAGHFVEFEPRAGWDSAVPMTIEAWVYRLDSTRFETILSHDFPGSYWLGFAPSLRFYRGTSFAEAPTPVTSNKWTHVAVSYDGAVARFYINGQDQGARPLSNTGAGKLRTLRVGHNGVNPEDFSPVSIFSGHLDEIRLWSVERSEEQIRDGLYREVRGEPGLTAAFPRGGRIEEVTGLIGSGTPPPEQVFGIVPRDLVVPRSAFTPFADGFINFDSEYLGAEQLVVRYPDQPTMPDMVAHFVRTDDDLFVAAKPSRDLPGDWSITNSWLSLYIDTTNARPALAGYPQIEIRTQLDGSGNRSTLLNGDGAGGYFLCRTATNGIGSPQLCTPRTLWQVAQGNCGEEFPLEICTEFRVSRALLGSFSEFDGVALGQINLTPSGATTFIPEDGLTNSPATWLTMSYGEGSANLPRVHWSGRVFAGLSGSRPLADYRVSLSTASAGHSRFTDTNGVFVFNVPMPTGQVIFAQAELEAFGRYTLPRVFTDVATVAPSFVDTNRVIFPALSPTASAVTLASVDFFVQRPLPAAAITSASPANPQCGMVVRQGELGGPGEVVTLFGTNLHAEMEFYLSPFSPTFPTSPAAWTLLPVHRVIRLASDGRSVDVEAPFVPEQVREHIDGFFIPSFQAQWRWVAHDSWIRPGRIEFSQVGTFSIRRPPYPIVHGFSFTNRAATGRLDEFLACYGDNAYIGVGPARVPYPLYWAIWFPVYAFWIDASKGSCVGMASAAVQSSSGRFRAADFDPAAFTANGIEEPGFPGEFDTSNAGGRSTRPPVPKDIWAHIRQNHGVQTTAEYLTLMLSQNDGTFSLGGFPVARLNEIRVRPSAYTICLMREGGRGHCITSYRVEDNVEGDPNLSRIWIYDNETPCARPSPASSPCVTNRFINVSLGSDQFGFDGVTGDGMFAIPVEVYNGSRTAPITLVRGASLTDPDPAAVLQLLMFVAGGADAHYTSPCGEWGWRADGSFVDNLPGLRAIVPLGSSTTTTRSIPVFLSVTNPVPTVSLNVRDTNAHLFHVGQNGTSLQLELTLGSPGARHQISLGARSNQLEHFRFSPQHSLSNFTPRVGLAFASNACAAFQWMGLNGEGGKVQEFRALKSRRAVEYCNETTRPTTHFLRIDAVDGPTTNNTCALFGPFTVPTGAVHCIVLHDWPRTKQVRSELDLNADGTPDQVTVVSGTPIDSDGDGMPDEWEVLHQLDPTSATGDDGADADPDGDGISNLGEYLSGTHPRDAASALRLKATMLPGNKVRLSWSAVPGRRYEILYADGLEHAFRPLTGAGFPRIAAATEEHFDDTLPSDPVRARFYRLRLVP